jgi:hypothetical protein
MARGSAAHFLQGIEFLFTRILLPWLKNKRKNRITLDEEWLEPLLLIFPWRSPDPLEAETEQKMRKQ